MEHWMKSPQTEFSGRGREQFLYKVELRPLQVRIPKAVFEEFSEQAGREFGFSHGSKKQLFLRMWEAYKAQNM